MTTIEDKSTPSLDFEHDLTRRIIERTGGRIHSLRVNVNNERVTISGVTSCYYFKQLALQSVIDAIGASPGFRLEFCIQVLDSASASQPNRVD